MPLPPHVPGLDFEYNGEPPLIIKERIYEIMIRHCRECLPNEACGILAGTSIPEAAAIYPLRNELASPTRYRADARDLIDAFKAMRSKNEQLLAIYHTHPASEPVPSTTDLDCNHYGPLPRLIVSCVAQPPEVRLWRLGPARYEALEWSIA